MLAPRSRNPDRVALTNACAYFVSRKNEKQITTEIVVRCVSSRSQPLTVVTHARG
jgi:hypothetical protein